MSLTGIIRVVPGSLISSGGHLQLQHLLPVVFIGLSALALHFCIALYNGSFRSSPKLPPGPPSWPVFGYLPGLPKIKPWEVFDKWSEKFGDIIQISSFKNHIIVLNSAEAITELLERRGSLHSDRPHMVMFHELMDLARATAFAPYGPKWRSHRKIYNQQMSTTGVKKFRDYQTSSARDFLCSLLESPEEFSGHCRTFAGSIVMNIAYGYQIARKNDEMVLLAESMNDAFAKASQPGFYLVDNLPLLRYIPSFFPFASFKVYAAKIRETVDQLNEIPFRRVVEQIRKGTARTCFVSVSLSELPDAVGMLKSGKIGDSKTEEEFDMESFENKPDVRAIRDIAGGIFGAGSATTVSMLRSFILAMILYPEIQRRAQEELDHVLGSCDDGPKRLPTFEDLEELPYINALSQEILRWFPVAPTAIPHATTQEDTYKGFRIPKGSILIPNVRKILHDPKVYPDPTIFRPERFLPDETGCVAPEPLAAFGLGRRICPGRHLADGSIRIMAASVLTVFNISAALDVNGKPVGVEHAFDGAPGLFSHPLPFECSIKPRSEGARKLILESCI